jgi:hypothetical protein
MDRNIQKLAQQILSGTGNDTLITAGQPMVITHIRAVNYSDTARTLKLWHDGTANGNIILPPVAIEAGGWGEFEGEILLEKGDTLVALASAATAIAITVYGEVL